MSAAARCWDEDQQEPVIRRQECLCHVAQRGKPQRRKIKGQKAKIKRQKSLRWAAGRLLLEPRHLLLAAAALGLAVAEENLGWPDRLMRAPWSAPDATGRLGLGTRPSPTRGSGCGRGRPPHRNPPGHQARMRSRSRWRRFSLVRLQ
jgi:hypothetical protein